MNPILNILNRITNQWEIDDESLFCGISCNPTWPRASNTRCHCPWQVLISGVLDEDVELSWIRWTNSCTVPHLEQHISSDLGYYSPTHQWVKFLYMTPMNGKHLDQEAGGTLLTSGCSPGSLRYLWKMARFWMIHLLNNLLFQSCVRPEGY